MIDLALFNAHDINIIAVLLFFGFGLLTGFVLGTMQNTKESLEIKQAIKTREESLIKENEKLKEKETPIEPFLEADGYWDGNLVNDTWICPCCETHYEVGCDEYDYCPVCGQHLNWEFEEED